MFKGFLKLMEYEFKLFIREPIAAFFTFIFHGFFLFLMMEVFIGQPVIEVPAGGHTVEIKVINYVLPNIMLMIIATTAFMSLPLTAIEYREMKFFKRLKANPVTPSAILAALGSAHFVITTCGVLLLTLLAVMVYGARIDGSILVFFASYLWSFLAIAAIGFGLIGSLLRTSRAALAVGQIVYFPAMFFSGVFVPLDQLPEWLRPVSDFIPITHAAKFMQGVWQGRPAADFLTEALILLGVLLLGALVAAKKFRWE